tara:strand:+ start:2766 stop:3161 length:396 start_codon:yes stop_codon:yes gene_type:complete
MDQSVIFHASQLQQQVQQLEESLKIIEQQTAELEQFSDNISFLEKSEEKELISSLGKGMFVKTELKDKDIFVDVGSGILVKKSATQSREIIESQLKKFKEARLHIMSQLESSQAQLDFTIKQIQDERNPTA